ncbi:hypothetical protein [Cohaesibacter gelatinilyticus]|uniref:Uncharacterized protein n=1 Tax=Cohaesibacter gelatinilyticus TaxID=372072 RepID=A0A285PHU8_9HYPH|nr:hypothetical protein [Cohaesibacter gelatinilyticus]SNZ21295.1 hypothetical protein SAMN06265368_4412 [Cohaesibacter gelatinilyticus]
MCMFGSKSPPPPTPPKEYAAAKSPTRAQAKSAGERVRDRVASRPQTLLTSPSGVGVLDTSGKKKLLGA